MKKFLTYILSFLILFTVALQSTACDNSSGNHEIFCLPNTVKVLREQEEFTSKSNTLQIESAKNEYEGGQIIIRAGGDIKSYNAEISDLKNGNSVISNENIEIYHQKYIEIKQEWLSNPSNPEYPAGWYPDALLPIETAVEYKENTVSKGNNQGIWITVHVPSDAEAGIYTGNVTVTMDNQTVNVPVELKVYDFALPEENHSKTAFSIWNTRHSGMLQYGELDASIEMYQEYYDFLLEYRISAAHVPTYELVDTAEYARVAVETVKNPKVASFELPYEAKNLSGSLAGHVGEAYVGLDEAYLESVLTNLVIESKNQNFNALSKAYVFFGILIDEPKENTFWVVKEIDNQFKNIKQRVADKDAIFEVDDTLSAAEQEKQAQLLSEIKESLLNINHIVTSRVEQGLIDLGGVDTWCPMFDSYGSEVYEYNAEQRRELYGENLWWYGCIFPHTPYPTYQIDDHLLSPRLISWMQMEKGIEGNLFWGVNVYKQYSHEEGQYLSTRNPYEIPYSLPNANGDGMLVYPGEYYGIYGPVASLRLEAIRDGMEDYEYLYLLEEKLNEANEKFGTEETISSYIEDIFKDLVYDNVKPVNNSELFRQAKNYVANLLELYSDQGVSLIKNKGCTLGTGKTCIEIYAEQDAVVKVNGRIPLESYIAGEGVKYVVYADANEEHELKITIEKDGVKSEFIENVGNAYREMLSFTAGEIENTDYVDPFNLTDSESLLKEVNHNGEFITDGDSSLKIGVDTQKAEIINQTVRIRFKQQQALDITDYNRIYFDAANTTDKTMYIELYLKDADSSQSKYISRVFVPPTEGMERYYIDILDSGEVDLGNIDRVELHVKFEVKTGSVYLDNLYLYNY